MILSESMLETLRLEVVQSLLLLTKDSGVAKHYDRDSWKLFVRGKGKRATLRVRVRGGVDGMTYVLVVVGPDLSHWRVKTRIQ